MKTTLIWAAWFVAVLLMPPAATSADEKLTPAEAKEIAKGSVPVGHASGRDLPPAIQLRAE